MARIKAVLEFWLNFDCTFIDISKSNLLCVDTHALLAILKTKQRNGIENTMPFR